MKRAASLCMIAGLLVAGDRGIRPRPSGADYPAQKTIAGITLAAAVMSPDQVGRVFATDLNRGRYIVVEVAAYPEASHEIDLKARDFLLRVGSDSTSLRPVTAQAIAAALAPKTKPPSKVPGNVTVYTESTIGYETGGVNGQRRGGVYTATGVGVGVGQPPVPPPGPGPVMDGAAIRQELEDLGLPEGRTTQEVAGYLFFPRPDSAKKDAGGYHLTYYAPDGQITLTIPPPRKK
jgi:hypothetical protein